MKIIKERRRDGAIIITVTNKGEEMGSILVQVKDSSAVPVIYLINYYAYSSQIPCHIATLLFSEHTRDRILPSFIKRYQKGRA